MVFSVVVNCFNNSFKIVHTAKQASSTNSRYDEMFSWNSSCYQLSGIFTFLVMFLGRRVWLIFFFAKRCLRHVLQLLNKQTKQTNKLTDRSQACPQRVSVAVPYSGGSLFFWRHFTGDRRSLPNLINASLLWRISRGILANQKRRNIWMNKRLLDSGGRGTG